MQEHSLVPKSRFELNNESSISKKEVKIKKENKAKASFFETESVASVDAKAGTKNPATEQIAVLLTNAEILMTHGENGLAGGLIRQALALDSHHAGALKKLARCIGDKGNLSLRQKVYEALNKSDYCFEHVAGLGHIYYLQNRDQDALQKYQEALSIITETSEGLFEVYKNLGNIMVRESDFAGAEEFYNKAFELDNQNDVLLVNLGTLDIQRKDFDQALERFRRALEINAKNDKAWVGLAMVHNHMGDVVLAKANLENAIDAQPTNRTAVHMFANWCVRDLNYSGGVEVLQNYLSKVESDEELSLVLIHLLCLTNRNDLALLESERVLLWNPKNGEIQKIEQSLRQSL